VIHLVSKVTGTVRKEDLLQLAADTFPAGTLSGAPKYRAIQLIDEYEPTSRTFYGGAIGILGFNGSYNHAIMIRTFCGQNNVLYYQAGAGIVDKSIPALEVEEVNLKIGALRAAIQSAQKL
jgi:anthranilate synthase component 1